MRLNWSFSSIRLSIIWVTALTEVCQGKGTLFSLPQMSSRSLMLQSPQGQYPNSIQQRTMPHDQISALLPYTSWFSTYGAMQRGDPSEVCVKSSAPFRRLQKPKSASFRCPDLKKMLLGLISRCRMKFSWRDFMAEMSCLNSCRASRYGRHLRLRTRSSSVPPSQYQQTRQTQLLVLSISTNLTTFKLSSSTFRVSISLRVSSASLPTSAKRSSATILTATSMRVSMWKARQTLPYSPLPRQSVSVQLSTILTMAVMATNQIWQQYFWMIQLLLVIVALFEGVTASPITTQTAAPLKYYVFTEECFGVFFGQADWLHAECLKKTLIKLLGYAVVAGAAIVKVPQIVKIVKKQSTFGVSFAGVILESFTQLSAVAYNISRDNPFSVYGETLLIAVQCVIIHLLFIAYAKGKERTTFLIALLPVLLAFYAAINPAYFPQYIIENAMVAQIILFSGARLFQIYEIHKSGATGSLSQITCTLVVLGNLSRLATALVQVADDYLYKISVFIALALNGYILLCFLIFRKSSSPSKPSDKTD